MYWVIFVHDRIKIAKEFAETIKSDDIKLIMLFGSVARGDDSEESDIDILIVSPIADKIKPEIHKIAMDIILEKDEVIKRSADTYNPSLLTQYLLNLCKNFNHFYEKVNISKTEIQEKYNFYIRLLLKLKKIIEEIFDILGMNIIEHM